MGLDMLLFFSLPIQYIHVETRHSRLSQASEQCFHKTPNIPPSCNSDFLKNSLESYESIALKLADDDYAWFPHVYSE